MNGDTFMGLVHNAALLLALAVVYDALVLPSAARRPLSTARRWGRRILTGALLGLVGVALMVTPWRYSQGVIFDTRSILLSIAGLFFGLIPTAIAVLMTSILRVLQGGSGTFMGLAVIFASAGLGVGWRTWLRDQKETPRWFEFYGFGIVVHGVMLLATLLLPLELRAAVSRQIAVPVMAIYPVVTVLLGLLLTHQRDRLQGARELQNLSARNQTLLAAVPDIIMEVNNDRVYTWANEPGLDFFGQDVVGKEAATYFEGEQATYGMVQPLFNGVEDAVYVESWQRRRDGQKRLLAWWCRTLKDPSGVVVGALSSARDITEHRRAEEEIRRLNAELEQRVAQRTAQLQAANQELESFSYSVSHDLRAPLRAVSGFASIIARRHSADLNSEGQHYVDNIVVASKRMERLIDDLLHYSRLGRSGVHSRPVALAEVFAALDSDLAPRLAETGGTLTIAEDLPVVMGDRTLLGQIFTNLLSNAIIYHKPGVPPQVTVTCRVETGNVAVCVRDNGIGIPPEYHEKIFDVFQRLHSDDEYPGTGIGLATVRKSAALLGASVWVESAPDQGSTFCVELERSNG